MRRLKSSDLRLTSTVVATLLAIPLGWGELTGFSVWLSPFIMLNSIIVLKSLVWLNILVLPVLIISYFKKRWFCRNLCPVGFACDNVSKISFRKNYSLHKIPRLNRWFALMSIGGAITGIPLFILLDPLAIFNGFFAIFSKPVSLTVILSLSVLPVLLAIHLLFPGIWCSRLCPLGGLLDEISGLKNTFAGKKRVATGKIKTINRGRRVFIASGAGLLAGLVVPRWLNNLNGYFLRPPGSTPNSMFNTLCIRCGNCIKACPSQIIIHHTDIDDLTAWMTPEVSFDNNGYCLEDCNRCGTVCPSGAISPFEVEAKKDLFMASIEIDIHKCLLTDQTECDRCKSVCSYKAVRIIPGDLPLTMKPVADTDKCVGCGACAAVCPPSAITMTRVNSK